MLSEFDSCCELVDLSPAAAPSTRQLFVKIPCRLVRPDCHYSFSNLTKALVHLGGVSEAKQQHGFPFLSMI
ncbi:hypothetical protein GJ744_008044 [Endocarpon pusillum]|uniref:Uncharacterized protein n=1 Tax=Endocarpon pusillum TaxID=364733 RepID=A0A8H7AM39_9EURO|nr:hypothetical protein GJ744_008044 [Endocarpon pusillum]